MLTKTEKTTLYKRGLRVKAKQLGEIGLIERIDLASRYWPNVTKGDGCWMWNGSKDGAGYGVVWVLAWPVGAHRIAYTVANGPIAKGLEVCHRCDAPLCVNPDHLFTATHAENMRDMREKGRWAGFPNHFDENGNRKVCGR
jgi:hypothetical protein